MRLDGDLENFAESQGYEIVGQAGTASCAHRGYWFVRLSRDIPRKALQHRAR